MIFFPPLDQRLEWSVVASRLDVWAPAWDKTKVVTFLDVGAAGLSDRVEHWARRRGLRVEITRLGAREAAASGRKFAYVIGSTFLQAVPAPELPEVLRLCDRVSSRGLLFSEDARVSPALLEHAADEAGLGYLRVRRAPFARLSLAGERH